LSASRVSAPGNIKLQVKGWRFFTATMLAFWYVLHCSSGKKYFQLNLIDEEKSRNESELFSKDNSFH
jgi:hypothetical protein